MDADTPQTSTIDPALFTIIIQFQVDASDGEAFARELAAAAGDTVVGRPGFRTSVFHLSADRTRVLNHAQWDSAQAYRSSMSDDHPGADAAAVGEVVARYGAQVVHAGPYEIVTTFASEG